LSFYLFKEKLAYFNKTLGVLDMLNGKYLTKHNDIRQHIIRDIITNFYDIEQFFVLYNI